MKEILLVNPTKKRRKKKTTRKRVARKSPVRRRRTTRSTTTRRRKAPVRRRRVYTMATKKRRTTRRKAPRKNPRRRRSTARRTIRRAARAVGQSFMGLNFKKALTNVAYHQIGMFAAKWLSKRWDDATESDPTTWDWTTYAKGAAGAVGAAILMNQIKSGSGQKVLEGGLNFVFYKVIQNELVQPSTWGAEQFGAEDPYIPTEYLLTGDDDDPYGFDDDGEEFPVDDRHRLPAVSMMDGVLEPVGPLGDVLEPVGPLGEGDDYADALNY